MVPIHIAISDTPEDKIWMEDVDRDWQELDSDALHIGILRGGMQSGDVSLMIRIDVGDKSYVLQQTAKNFEAVMGAIQGVRARG